MSKMGNHAIDRLNGQHSLLQELVNRRPKKIALVGKAPSSFMFAPYDDPSWEIWGMSNLWTLPQFRRWDRYFELHHLNTRRTGVWTGHYEWMQSQEKPIFMQAPPGDIPFAVRYPIEEVTKRFGRYFTCTHSYMMAMAILMQPEEIGLWGVDMAAQAVGAKSEYAHQRPSCEFFIGVATGMGIRMHIPNASDLLKSYCLYGYEDYTEYQVKAESRLKEWRGKLDKERQDMAIAQRNMAYCTGALEECLYWQQWSGNPPDAETRAGRIQRDHLKVIQDEGPKIESQPDYQVAGVD